MMETGRSQELAIQVVFYFPSGSCSSRGAACVEMLEPLAAEDDDQLCKVQTKDQDQMSTGRRVSPTRPLKR